MEKSLEQLQNMAVNFLEYQKGRALNQRGQVTLFAVEESRNRIAVNSSVRDLSSRYDVFFHIRPMFFRTDGSWDSFEIEESSCSCNEYRIPGKLCRHQVASLLQYFFSGKLETKVHTSNACIGLIQNYRQRYTMQFHENEKQPVKLVPRFVLEGKKVYLEFSAGVRHLYPVRDLILFQRSYQKGEEISFGKQLRYLNCDAAYDSESTALVQVLCLHVETYLHCHSDAYQCIPAGQKLSRMELESGFADLYMKALTGRKPECVRNGKSEPISVLSENPKVKLILERKGKDGAHLWMPEKWQLAQGNRHIYLFGASAVYICDPGYSDSMRNFFYYILIKAYPGSGRIDLNEKDIPAFIKYVLSQIQKYITLECRDISLEQYAPPGLQADFFVSMDETERLTLKAKLSYGNQSIILGSEAAGIVRDELAENRIRSVIEQYFEPNLTGNVYFLENSEKIYGFLEFGLPQLREYGSVFQDENILSLHFEKAPQVKVGMRFLDHFMELTFDSEELNREEMEEYLRDYEDGKQYHRKKDGSIFRLDKQLAKQLQKLEQGLGLDRSQMLTSRQKLPAYRFLFADEMLSSMNGIQYHPGQEIHEMVEHMKRNVQMEAQVPPMLTPVLREYQKYGYSWLKMLESYGFHGILADDMGLGKTIQTIALLASDAGRGCSLIICPASLIYNWQHEFETFAPQLKTLSLAGNAAQRKSGLEAYRSYDVIITSYDLLRRDFEAYQSCSFFYQILDEAQFIKNYHTMNAKAVKSIHAEHRLALTGTPIENRLSELWSIFDFLMPGYLFSYMHFRKEFELAIERGSDPKAADQLRKMTAPFILRRKKDQVLPDLPEKDEKTIYSCMGDKQAHIYKTEHQKLVELLRGLNRDEFEKNRIMILSQLTKLRQLCCHPQLCIPGYDGESAKLEACMELVHRAISANHKVLLFSQFTSMLDLIRESLRQQGIAHYTLTGSTGKEERQRLVDTFQSDETPVFLISLKAGGTGLNLTAADIVIHFDPWWNVAAQNQATDRAHRIGQEKKVSVFKLIAKNTLEEGILKLQASKQNLSDDILSMDFGIIAGMTKEELISLLEE